MIEDRRSVAYTEPLRRRIYSNEYYIQCNISHCILILTYIFVRKLCITLKIKSRTRPKKNDNFIVTGTYPH